MKRARLESAARQWATPWLPRSKSLTTASSSVYAIPAMA
jgi:hypothetical protein